nr:MAG TPA: hypothetical protein [Caudoviricetes sp.]
MVIRLSRLYRINHLHQVCMMRVLRQTCLLEVLYHLSRDFRVFRHFRLQHFFQRLFQRLYCVLRP